MNHLTPLSILPADQLPALASLAGEPPLSAFDTQPALLIAAARLTPSPPIRQQVAAWLLRQPCPVIAIGAASEVSQDPWADIYDVVVADEAAASSLLAAIRQAPQAATVLVQTLRHTAGLPVDSGLLVESLAFATLQSGAEFSAWAATRQPQTVAHTDSGPPLLMTRTTDRPHHLEIRLNRASRRNAMSVEMRNALVEAMQLLLTDTSIRSATVSGEGDCFSIGGDLDEFGTTPDAATAHLIRTLRLPAPLLARCAERVEFRLHGACIGAGIELPAFAGRVVATAKTFFQLPELKFGLIPGAGGCISLPRRIGRQRTAWLVLTGRRINASTALEWGLIDAIEESRT
ncbi:MAG: enoyl-CoA hydratase/isomerase family protein [Sterolibacterium sp.]|nr:enoyl-CoA hydratase/isomerase family protein [Sterolibacterium sp.]